MPVGHDLPGCRRRRPRSRFLGLPVVLWIGASLSGCLSIPGRCDDASRELCDIFQVQQLSRVTGIAAGTGIEILPGTILTVRHVVDPCPGDVVVLEAGAVRGRPARWDKGDTSFGTGIAVIMSEGATASRPEYPPAPLALSRTGADWLERQRLTVITIPPPIGPSMEHGNFDFSISRVPFIPQYWSQARLDPEFDGSPPIAWAKRNLVTLADGDRPLWGPPQIAGHIPLVLLENRIGAAVPPETIRPGHSGSPVVTADGTIVGLIESLNRIRKPVDEGDANARPQADWQSLMFFTPVLKTISAGSDGPRLVRLYCRL